MDLLDQSSSEGEAEQEGFSINKNYAERYEAWRGKEVMQRLKDKHGDDADQILEDQMDESSSEEESEDEDGEELTEALEKDFFRTLASLKAKDPRIYDNQTQFFSSSASTSKETLNPNKEDKEDKKKKKKITLGDMERKIMLEKEGKYDELEDKSLLYDQGKTYAEELRDITASLKKAADSSDEEEEDEDDLLKPRQKTEQEKVEEETDYKAWLAGQRESLPDQSMKEDLSGLKSFWSRKDLDAGEKFLKDYLLNKRYKEAEDAEYVPTYDEIVHDSDENLSEDEKNVAEQEEFEHKFNFRFEEPDAEFIKRYPRTIKDTVRKTDDKRKTKRKEVEERKKEELQQKKEELKLLKSIKKKEILDKLDKLKKITGNEDMALRDEDIEGDFDPAAYDQRMKELFETYDKQAEVDSEKPTFSDLEDEEYEQDYEEEDWDNWEGAATTTDGDAHCEDPEFNMDCDYNEQEASHEREMIANSRGRKGNRRRSKFAAALEDSRSKPTFNPDDKTFEEYVEEYYKLDCEDIIGDLPCRFKYRTVEANDFGLSTDEIITADDKELNAWVSLRKTCQYRSQDDERRDQHVFRSKGKNFELKQKLLPSLFTAEPSENDQPNKKKRKKKNKKNKNEEEDPAAKRHKPNPQNQTSGHPSTSHPKSGRNGQIDKYKSQNHAKSSVKLAKHGQEKATKQGNQHKKGNSKETPVKLKEIKVEKVDEVNGKSTDNILKNGVNKNSKNSPAKDASSKPDGVEKKPDSNGGNGNGALAGTAEGSAKKRRNKKKKNKNAASGGPAINMAKVIELSSKVANKPMSEDRLKAFGLNPAHFDKITRKQKYKQNKKS